MRNSFMPWMVYSSSLLASAASKPVDLNKPVKTRKSQQEFIKLRPEVMAWQKIKHDRPDSRQVRRHKERQSLNLYWVNQ